MKPKDPYHNPPEDFYHKERSDIGSGFTPPSSAPDYAIITSVAGDYVRPNATDYVVTRV